MSLYILIHKRNNIEEAANCVYEELNRLYPDEVDCYDKGLFIVIDNIKIDFRCILNRNRLAGIRPDFFYTNDESWYVNNLLQMSALPVDGKELNSITQVIPIVTQYINLNRKIDEWLKSEV